MTLVTRLLLFFLSMLALVLIGFSGVLYLLAASALDRRIEERLESTLNTLSSIAETSPEGVEWEPGNRHANLDSIRFEDQVVWQVTDDQRTILDRSKGETFDAFVAEALSKLSSATGDETSGKWNSPSWAAGRRRIDAVPRLPDGTSTVSSDDDEHLYRAICVTVGVSRILVRSTLQSLARLLIGLSIVVWLIALVAGRFVCRRALSPVSRMALAARQIDADRIAERLPLVTTHDELQDLNHSFNSLLDRLQVSFERQRRFTGDASHQLRTPLTAILGQIEVALRRERPASEYRQVLEKVQKKARHLAGMVEGLLFLARADSESIQPGSEPIELTTWLPQHLQTWSDHARTLDLILQCETDDPCTVNAQPSLLCELLDILIDNACKYSEPGTPIMVRLQQAQNVVSVSVEDQGCGIDRAECDHLFEPFSRTEDVRRRGVEGVGLGLSIAKRLAQVFGGELTLASRPSLGSRFTVTFPTTQEHR